MSNIAPLSPPIYKLTALTGPEKGSVFKITSTKVSIGRSAQNDISIKDDPRMSRNHAIITFSKNKIEIADVSDHNKVLVNGEPVTRAEISSNDTIQLGETQFRLELMTASLPNPSPDKSLLSPATSTSLNLDRTHVALKAANAVTNPRPQQAQSAVPRSSSRHSQSAYEKKRNFYIVVGALILIFVWLLTSQVKTKTPVAIRSEESVQEQLEQSRKTVELAEEARRKMGLDTKQFEEAQPNFVKGFRDYKKGQYERAIESFQACLSLLPNHIQCQRYLRLSQKKFSELVQYHMILANKYKTQNQFAACKASYRNVMVMLRNPNDKTYIEAKAGHDVCQALEGERY